MSAAMQTLGEKIRAIRKQKRMTLSQMASTCDCSPSLLSQVETGYVNPSISTLKEIGDALGVSFARLVTNNGKADDASSCLIKADGRKVLTMEGGARFQLLSRNLNVPFEFIFEEWPPGCSTGKHLYTHEGEECGLLLEGEIEVEVGAEVHHMKPGDSITLLSSIPHRVSNPGKRKAMAVWVNSIPWVFSTK